MRSTGYKERAAGMRHDRGGGEHQHGQEGPEVHHRQHERRVHRVTMAEAVACALLCTWAIRACTLGSVIAVKVVG